MGDLISSLLFQPPSHPTYLHPSRHFWLTTKYNTRIPAFFIERPNAKVTILFSHGNAEDLGMIYDWFNDLARVLRVNIMAYDYSGYGKSTGTGNVPSEEHVYADIEAAYKYLLEVRKLQPSEIVLYGRSLGSGPSCYLAQKTANEGRSVAGVILQSPLLSAFRVAFNFRFTVVWDKFPNVEYAPFIRCPVFIIHGTNDEVVPFSHGEDLFISLEQCWRAKPFWVEGAGHNNIEALLRPSGAFVDKLIEFLDLHISARRGNIAPPIPVPDCVPLARLNYALKISQRALMMKQEKLSKEKAELIEIWTKAFLAESERRVKHHKRQSNKYKVVFGRTTHGDNTSTVINYIPCSSSCGQRQYRVSFQGSDDNADFVDSKDHSKEYSKQKGRQIMISKIDIDKAREKRKRQLKYSAEIQSSKQNYVALQISSITRIVVQSFRKLIDCERCALFLMDHSTNELYFKPVGETEHDTDAKEIRFPASAGVAGYVATKGVLLNIRDAYHDNRFNSEIDKQTNFRTRSILCAPVLSSMGHLFGVIQMVNKKKGDSKLIQSIAKKKKTDNKHHGYASCFEPFSTEDEQILDLCCCRVSKSLEPVLCPTKDDNATQEVQFDSSRKTIRGSHKDRRRSSVGNLVQFVNSMEPGVRTIQTRRAQPGLIGVGVCEALTKFQFRTTIVGPQMSAKAHQKDDPERLLAATKRKRMVDYNLQCRFREK